MTRTTSSLQPTSPSRSRGTARIGPWRHHPCLVPANCHRSAKYEYALLKKTKELSAVQERLYYVRWDKTRSPADQKLELTVRASPPSIS